MYSEWAEVSKEDILSKKPVFEDNAHNNEIYITQKTLAEQAVWEFADQHPHVEVTSSQFSHIVIKPCLI